MINNKKIMMLTTTDNMIWQFLLPHIKYLQEQGNVVECVCAKTGFWFDELNNKYGLTMHEVDFCRNPLKIKNFQAYKKLKQIQNDCKFDLIYCQQPVGGMMGRLLAKKFNIPVIYTAHGFHFFKGAPIVNTLLYKPVEKWLSKYTDILITINEEDYQNALKMKAKKVFKINGIGMEFKKYDELLDSREQIRESLNVKEDEFVIVTVAEFIKRKNYDTMLNIIRGLKDKGIKVKFLICGRGQDEEKIKQQIAELEIQEQVNLLGYRKDINRILTGADLFMLASFQEGLTLAVIEAMSYGVPCAVSDVRGNRDLIVDNQGGIVVDATDDEAFVDRISQLINNKEKLTQMGEFNKEESKKYDINIVLEQLAKIYGEIEC